MSGQGESSVKFKTRAGKGKNTSIGKGELSEDGHGVVITEVSELHVGKKVEAMDKYGKWYVAKVVELEEEDKEVLVHFEKWSSRYDEYIPLKSGRLHLLSQSRQEEMEREKEKMKKQLSPGDHVQAKWTDGRMYYGKVMKLNDADVDLLFDDGVVYTAPFSDVRKRISSKVHEEQSQFSSSSDERRHRAEKRKLNEDPFSSPPSSPLSSPPKKRHRSFFDSDSTEMESDQDVFTTVQGRSQYQKQGGVRSGRGEMAAKNQGEVRSGSDEIAAKKRSGIRSGSEETAPKKQGEGGSEVIAAKKQGEVRSGGEEIAAKKQGGIRSGREETAARQQGGIRSGSEEITSRKQGWGGNEEIAVKKQGGVRSGGKEIAARKRGGIRSGGEEAAAKKLGGIRSDHEETEAKKQGGIRSGREEAAAKKQGGIRSGREETEAKKQGGIRSCREEVAAKKQSGIRSGGEEVAAKKQGEVKSSGEETAAKKKVEVRSGDGEIAAKKLGDIRSGGEEITAKKQGGVISGDGETTVKKQDQVRKEVVTEKQGRTRSDNGEQAIMRQNDTRSEGGDVVTQSKGKAIKLTSGEEESQRPRSVEDRKQLSSVSEGKEVVKMAEAEGASGSVLTALLNLSTSTERGAPKPAADAISLPVTSQEMSEPASSDEIQVSNSGQGRESSSRPRRTRGPSRSTPKSSVATRTRAHASNTVEKKLPVKQMRSTAAIPSKGVLIEWDHNEFKCKVSGCTKSFRKQTLLESHLKHYHTSHRQRKPTRRGEKTSFTTRVKTKSPKPSLSPSSNTDAKDVGEVKKSPGSLSLNVHENKSSTPSSLEKPEPKSSERTNQPVKEPSVSSSVVVMSTAKDLPVSAEKDAGRGQSGVKTGPKTSIKPSKQSQKGGTSRRHMEEVVSIARPSIKAPPTMGRGHQDNTSPSIASGVTTLSSTSSQSVRKHSVIVETAVTREESAATICGPSPKLPTPSEDSSDDVVHCVCGSDVDEGFMIQCEECLCWQHGDCIGIRTDVLPKKYTCYTCSNPPGIRSRLKYKYSRDWYGEGTLPSMPSAPHFSPAQSKAVLLSHKMTDNLYRVKKMMHSSEVKLQAARNPQHPYLKQWGKECSHYGKGAIMAYSMSQLLPMTFQPTDDNKQEVADHDIVKKEVEEATGRTEDFLNTTEAAPEIVVEEEDSETEDIASKRELRASTTVQKQALYISPKRSRKCKGSPSSSESMDLERKEETIEEGNINDASPLPSSSAEEERKDVKPLSPLSPVNISTTTNILSTPHTSSLIPQSVSTNISSVTSIVNPSTGGASDLEQHSTKLMEPKIEPAEEELMEIISQDEFGVSEVPVFAVEADRLPHPPVQVLPPLSIITTPTSAVRLGGGSGSNTIISNPPSFSPSAQSAFRPVTAVVNKPSPHKIKITSMNTNILGSTPDLNLDPSARTLISEASIPPVPSSSRMEPVTLGEFAEAFVQGDTTNWFRRMKLLDHVESVQDNVQAWLDLIQKKLTELPDTPIMSDDSDKILSELHSTLQKLKDHSRTNS